MLETELWAHNDESRWGVMLALAAGRRDKKVNLFRNTKEVPQKINVMAFVRLDQHQQTRERSRSIVFELYNRGINTLQTEQEARWYDDKMEQYTSLKSWLPFTYITTDEEKAKKYLKETTYPFISKSREGASSKGVRLIRNEDEGLREVKNIFSPTGMRSGVYDRIQKGYVYWQKFMLNNPCDYRWVINGNYWYGAIRDIRDENNPFASGSGKFYPISKDPELFTSRELISLNFCHKIAKTLRTKWMAFDVVFDNNDTPYLLEISSSWTPDKYSLCDVYYKAQDFWYKHRIYKGGHMFDLAVDIMINGGN